MNLMNIYYLVFITCTYLPQKNVKLILFIDNNLVYKEHVSNFVLSCNDLQADCQYNLAELLFTTTDFETFNQLSSEDQIDVNFSWHNENSLDKEKLSFSIKKKELFSSYLIVRLYTKTRKNQKLFNFKDLSYVYEYESPFGYSYLPKKSCKKIKQFN